MIAPIKDRFGLISPTGNVSQNGVLFSAYFVAATGVMTSAIHTAVANCCWYGLRRSPESHEPESHDNYLALAYLASIQGTSKMSRTIELVIKNRYIIQDSGGDGYRIRPWYKRWLGRFHHMPVCLKRSVRVEPNWLEKAAFYISVYWMCRSFRQGDNGALMVLLMLQINPSPRLEKYFWKRVREVHFTLSHCARDYFQIDENHFMAQVFKEFG